jgi:hypothetical protein
VSKQRISDDKRWALWKAHRGRCPYCNEPVRLLDMQVDHVLPELLASDPARLASVKREYGLEDSFSLFDYDNWLPAHPACNRRKSGTVPGRILALSLISIAKAKASLAREGEARLVGARRADDAVGKMIAAVQRGLISRQQVEAALARVPGAVRADFDPIVVGFSAAVAEVVEGGALPGHVPMDYPSLCDWLEGDLHRRVQSATTAHFFCPEASARNGETLSIRLAFTKPDLEALSNGDWGWWEILEVDYYSDLYGPQGNG